MQANTHRHPAARLGAALLTLTLCLTLLPTAAWAENETGGYDYLEYVEEDGAWVPELKNTSTALGPDTPVNTIDNSSITWNDGWYVVQGEVTISQRITVSGNVHLILADDCTLTAKAGITVSTGNSLTIYGQQEGTGKLTATGGELAFSFSAGIGGYNTSSACGSVTIHGGVVTAKGGEQNANAGAGAGIGGAGGIGGGVVTAVGGDGNIGLGGGGAGIGGGGGGTPSENTGNSGDGGSGGSVTITGGTVTATGGNGKSNGGGGAGIGGGGGGSKAAGGGAAAAAAARSAPSPPAQAAAR